MDMNPWMMSPMPPMATREEKKIQEEIFEKTTKRTSLSTWLTVMKASEFNAFVPIPLIMTKITKDERKKERDYILKHLSRSGVAIRNPSRSYRPRLSALALCPLPLPLHRISSATSSLTGCRPLRREPFPDGDVLGDPIRLPLRLPGPTLGGLGPMMERGLPALLSLRLVLALLFLLLLLVLLL